MKKIILLFSVLISIGFSAQTKEDLIQVSKKIIDNSINGNYSAVFEESYPAIFEVYPKAQFLNAMNLMLNNPNFKIEIMDVPPNIQVSKIIEKEGNKYAEVSYDVKMKMTFKNNFTGDLNLVQAMLKQQTPDAEIEIDEEEKTIGLKRRASVYAISDELTKHQWKLINNEQNYYNFVEQYVPEDVIEKLKK